MKIKNNGEAFEVRWNSIDYKISKGEMEINNEGLGLFIIKKARQWGLDIVKTAESKRKAIEAIEEIIEVEEVKEEAKEEVKEEKKTKKTKK